MPPLKPRLCFLNLSTALQASSVWGLADGMMATPANFLRRWQSPCKT